MPRAENTPATASVALLSVSEEANPGLIGNDCWCGTFLIAAPQGGGAGCSSVSGVCQTAGRYVMSWQKLAVVPRVTGHSREISADIRLSSVWLYRCEKCDQRAVVAATTIRPFVLFQNYFEPCNSRHEMMLRDFNAQLFPGATRRARTPEFCEKALRQPDA